MLPNLIIIGAQKCGTTSLHYYLSLHPEIFMSKEKELNFFVLERNWPKGIAWYESQFSTPAKVRGESSPSYTVYPFYPGVPGRMHSIVPDAKLIYCLRDPIERIISGYRHAYADGFEDRDMTAALKDFIHNRYTARSQYFRQLEVYLEYFNPAQILMITLEDLSRDGCSTLKQVFRFLEVDDSFSSRRFSRILHNSRYKRRKNRIGLQLEQTRLMRRIQCLQSRWLMNHLIYFPFSRKVERPALDPVLRQELIDFLKPDVERLRAFTGRAFADWSL